MDVLSQVRIAVAVDFIAHCFDNRFDAAVDMFQGFDDFGDALACDILEITGFENAGGAVDQLFVNFGGAFGGQRAHFVADIHNAVGGVFGRADDGIQFIRRIGNERSADIVGLDLGDLTLGLTDIACQPFHF